MSLKFLNKKKLIMHTYNMYVRWKLHLLFFELGNTSNVMIIFFQEAKYVIIYSFIFNSKWKQILQPRKRLFAYIIRQ